jgi:hypothetical protein
MAASDSMLEEGIKAFGVVAAPVFATPAGALTVGLVSAYGALDGAYREYLGRRRIQAPSFRCTAQVRCVGSRVATYLGSVTEGRAFGVERYIGFNDCCRALATMPDAERVAEALSSRLDVQILPMRAIELVMFFGGLHGYSYAA